jgi:uncharacterized protein YbjT (DUF2867 family)
VQTDECRQSDDRSYDMFAITGITGQVGGALVRKLLSEGRPTRAVLRNRLKAEAWAALGCEIALAEMESEDQLAAAFKCVEGVFILPPSEFDPKPGYPEARRVIDAVVGALARARPKKVVCLSTIGADAVEDNLLSQRTLLEQALSKLDLPVTFLRPGWFMENATWDVASVSNEGVLRSFLQPADRRIAMVATQDVGAAAADLLVSDWKGKQVIELEGPARVSPDDIANAFASALGRPVRIESIPRASWEDLFRSQGMKNPMPRIRMIDGFNEGWIDFEGGHAMRGQTPLSQVISKLVAAAAG